MGVDLSTSGWSTIDNRESSHGNPDDWMLFIVVSKLDLACSVTAYKIDGGDITRILSCRIGIDRIKDGHYPPRLSRFNCSSRSRATLRNSSLTGKPPVSMSFTTSS